MGRRRTREEDDEMGQRKFPVARGSCHESEEEKDRDRDDLIEAGKRLKKAKAREAREATAGSGGESGVGVKSSAKAWDNHYPGKGAQ